MRASNLRLGGAYARRDLARMSVRYFVFQSFFTVILCKLWLVGLYSLQRAHDLRAGGQQCMRASNLRAYARRDLARMTARPESACMSIRYFVSQSFFTVILCKLWLVGL